ncbi:MlaD family protein [Nocardia salmonicida]|uniref:MlaD family protein n=1 Tax=Nocardia salmonicida TaxID=53431 RepID=UPI00341FD940
MRRRERNVGVLGIVVLVGALVAVGVLYAVPFGKRTYSALLPEAQSVRVGDDVRLAGLSVGSVTSLDLGDDHVEMRFTVSDEVFVGAQTSLDIRMLTIVGGHYVALTPAGTDPLRTPIPADRVRLPYSLIQTFQDAVAPVRAVDGAQLRANLDALGRSMEQSPDAIRQTIDSIGSFIDALNRQRADVSAAVAIADEYFGAVATARGELGRLVEKLTLLETMLQDKRTEVRTAVEQLDRVVSRLAAVQPTWESTLKPMAGQLAAAADELIALGDQLEPVITSVHELTQRMSQLVPVPGEVVVDQSAATVDAVCVPVAGRKC